jgi:hypothetical protein
MTAEGIDEPPQAMEDDCRRAKSVAPSELGTVGFGESVRLE